MADRETRENSGREGEEARTEKPGLGALLRDAREKKGLTIEQVAEITRVRRRNIEAIEREDWEALPPPVFVKGFLRAYARALGVEAEELLDTSGEAEALRMEPLRPLIEVPKGRRWRNVLIVLILCAVAGGLYFWKEGYWSVQWPGVLGRVNRLEKQLPKETPSQEAETFAPAPGGAPKKASAGKPEVPTAGIPEGRQEGESIGATSLEEEEIALKEHVLEAIVTQKTWMKIYIDDKDPRVYILQSGTRPQWKAEKGFNLVIGNAAGIELEFDGIKLENLGKTGQVVKLSLPEGFHSKKYEE
ncbi:MAG: helix-turn-helix domain-containing protein [Deltaproteobacteria bacterium]|nr:helix-turn-helix domain-containing protein [Deltaproteobacteria bacterium]